MNLPPQIQPGWNFFTIQSMLGGSWIFKAAWYLIMKRHLVLWSSQRQYELCWALPCPLLGQFINWMSRTPSFTIVSPKQSTALSLLDLLMPPTHHMFANSTNHYMALKQAPRTWFQRFKQSLLSLGYHASRADTLDSGPPLHAGDPFFNFFLQPAHFTTSRLTGWGGILAGNDRGVQVHHYMQRLSSDVAPFD